MSHRVFAALAVALIAGSVSAQQPSFSATVMPDPLTLLSGGAPATVTVSTQPQGYAGATITYSFSGFPGGIENDGPKSTNYSQASPEPYGPVTFTFAAAPGTPAGTYAGTLTGASSDGQVRIFPFTVIVQQPDVMVALTQPTMSLCAGAAPQSNSIRLDPVDGYQGTPRVNFLNVPAGVTISPNPLPPASLPPGRTIPFTVAADRAGSYAITVRVSDPQAGIDRSSTLFLQVAAADFNASVTPSQVEVTPGGGSSAVSASIVPVACLTRNVTIATSAPGGIAVSPATQTLVAPGYAPVSFAVQALAGTPAGTYPVTFTFTAAGTVRSVTIMVVVRDVRDFVLRANPPAVVFAAGTSAAVDVVVEPLRGFTGSVTVTGSAPAGLSITPATFTIGPNAPQRVVIEAPRATPPGQYTLTFTGTTQGIPQPRSVTVAVTVTPPADFALLVSPPAVAVPQGETITVSISAAGSNGFAEPVNVTVQAPLSIEVTPSMFTLQPGEVRTVSLSVATSAPVGTAMVRFSGVTPSGLARAADLRIDVVPVPPLITLLDPPAVTTGVRAQVVRVIGSNFRPGAHVSSRTPGVIIEQTQVMSPSLALVTLSVRDDAATGPYVLDLRNPDGGTTLHGATLLVYPQESIAAPLGVTAASIVFPRSGTLVASDEAVYARGLLATTGSGMIIGEWRLDGVAFDLFTAVVAGGMPTEVRSHAPIPPRIAGSARLELVVTSPQLTVSPSVTIAHAIDSASRLQIYEPREGTVIGRQLAPPVFRWTVVPGVTGYEIEVAETDSRHTIRFRTAHPEWHPSREDVAAAGFGIRRWRVRPLFPGDVRGEPSRWNRIVLLPEEIAVRVEAVEVDARSGEMLVRWSGGGPGVVYRVEFFDAAGDVVLQGLALGSDYRIPGPQVARLRGTQVRIVAISPDGYVLATSHAHRVARGYDRTSGIFLAQAAPMPRLTATEPREGAEVTTDRPRIRAAWSEPVAADEVALMIDTTDVTAVATVTPTSITYDALLPLAAGTHTARLSAGALTSSWTFTVAAPNVDEASAGGATAPEPGETPAPGAAGVPAAAAARRDWALTPLASVSVRSGEGEQDDAALQLSTQADLGTPALSSKLAGDLSFRHPLEGEGNTRQESQNWLMHLGATQGAFREQVTAGYSVPDFLDQTQFLTFGAARGGISANVATPIGRFSAFETFESTLTGVVAGSFAPIQKISAYAYDAPMRSDRWTLRAIALDVDEEPGLYSAGGRGDTVGVFSRYALSRALTIVAEVARGAFESRSGSEREREGDAFRLGLNGTAGRLSYAMNLRRTDAGYVNPANRGFTAGGVSDRQGGDLSVSTFLGRTSISVTARHLESGRAGDSSLPVAREDGVTATVSSMLGRILTISASMNVTADESDDDVARGLPGISRRVGGGQLTFGQLLGRFNLSQTLQYNRTESRRGPYGDAAIRGVTLTGTGPLTRFATLSAFISAIRSETTPEAGANDQMIVTLQPSIALPHRAFSFQPVVSWSRMENERLLLESETQSFMPMLTWTPPWLQQSLALQVSGGWRRTETLGQPRSEPDPTYGASLSFRWPLRRGVRGDDAVLPGLTPIAAPEQGSSDPVHTADALPPVH